MRVLSYTFWTVASSGKPSTKFNVPSRVSTLSGVVMATGMSVVIFIFGIFGAAGVVLEADPGLLSHPMLVATMKTAQQPSARIVSLLFIKPSSRPSSQRVTNTLERISEEH